jgi:hypothetical protein
VRAQVREPKGVLGLPERQLLSSGFFNVADFAWCELPGFVHLKLHGVCAYPNTKPKLQLRWPRNEDDSALFTSEHLFRFSSIPRMLCLADSETHSQDPPTLLPWEIIHEDGRIVTEEEFSSRTGGSGALPFPLCKAIWERARREVQQATKISFVGLSLNEFMEPELKYLFEGKKGDVQMVFANPENKKFPMQRPDREIHPRSLRGRALPLFQKIAPQMTCLSSENNTQRGFITARNDFRDFMEWGELEGLL